MSNGELVIGFNFKYFSYLCLYSLTFVLSASLISGRLFPPRPRPLPPPRPPLLAGKIPKREKKNRQNTMKYISATTPAAFGSQIREQMLVPDLHVHTLKLLSNFSL